MPSIKNRWFEVSVLIALGLWGLVSVIQGAALGMFVSGPDQYRATTFIELVYESVFGGVLIALFSPRLGAILTFAAALVAVIIVYQTGAFGHGSETAKSFFEAIVIRPGLATVLLGILPAIGPMSRLFLQRRAESRTK
jgi:hypothetical protein